MKLKITHLALLLACHTTLATAQDTLTIDMAKSLALAHNKEIRAARKQSVASRFTAQSVKAQFTPSFAAQSSVAYSSAEGTLMQMFPYEVGWLRTVGASVTQPLYLGGRLRAAYATAQAGAKIATLSEAMTEDKVLLDVEKAYADAVKAEEMVSVAEAYDALLRELDANVASGIHLGLASKADGLRVAVKLRESELNMLRAHNALRLAAMNLCRLTGLPLASDLPRLQAWQDPDTVNGGEASLVSGRKDYQILTQKTAIAEQELRAAKAELLPTVTAVATYGYTRGVQLAGSSLLDGGYFTAFFNVSMPLFHFGERTNRVRAARERVEQARLSQEAAAELMELDIMSAANNLAEARLEVTLCAASLNASAESLRLATLAYEKGTETLSSVLEAQAAWLSACQSLTEARHALTLRASELRTRQ